MSKSEKINKAKKYKKMAISPAEAAELLGVGMPKIYSMTHMDGFPAIRIGRRVLIPVEQLKSWLAEQVED